jgi:hypothetical protein
MRVRFNYILFFLLFLSLFGLGNDQFTPRTSVKYLKETEWITKPSSFNKASKCFHFNLVCPAVSSNLTSYLWEKGLSNAYNRKLTVLFIIQTKLYKHICLVNLIPSKRYIPRLFTDDHYVSYQSVELIKQFCTASGFYHQIGKIMWDHLLIRTWINQKESSNLKGRDDLNGCLNGYL